jgi:hypothetical protein
VYKFAWSVITITSSDNFSTEDAVYITCPVETLTPPDKIIAPPAKFSAGGVKSITGAVIFIAGYK